jgi:hypothetical protein
MKRFVEGADRGQSTLFPECLDDWIEENNPVRASPRVRILKEIRTMIRPEPAREPLPPPKQYEPPRAGGRRRR